MEGRSFFVLRMDQERYVEGAVDIILPYACRDRADHDEDRIRDVRLWPLCTEQRQAARHLYGKYAKELVERQGILLLL